MTSNAARELALKSWKGRRKLTPSQREAIRRRKAAGESAADLAAEYGVSWGYVYMLARGER